MITEFKGCVISVNPVYANESDEQDVLLLSAPKGLMDWLYNDVTLGRTIEDSPEDPGVYVCDIEVHEFDDEEDDEEDYDVDCEVSITKFELVYALPEYER